MTLFISLSCFICAGAWNGLAIPMMMPIYVKEIKSRLYSVNAYLLSYYAANLLTMLFYTILVDAVVFFFFNIKESDFEIFFIWISFMVILNLSGSSFAFVLGTFCNDNDAILFQLMFFVIFNLGSGVFANLAKANSFIYYC